MKLNSSIGILALFLFSVTQALHAAVPVPLGPTPPGVNSTARAIAGVTSAAMKDSQFYYAIGGAMPMAFPNAGDTRATASVGAGFSFNFSCGKFDFNASISNLWNHFRDTAANVVTNAVNNSIAALPSYILHRVNPDLYDVMRTIEMNVQALIDMSSKSCQQIEADMREGKNPFDDLVKVSASLDWRSQMGGSSNIVSTRESIDANLGINGVVWVAGSRRGGTGQPPIRPARDTVRAGWNFMLDRPADAVGPIAGSTAPLVQYWATPDDAANWLADAIGDIEASTTPGGARQATPPRGLSYEAGHTANDISNEIDGFVTAALQMRGGSVTNPNYTLTPNNLARINAPGMAVTRQVIESLTWLTEGERFAVVNRMAGEIAMARVMDKALMARRLLETGRFEPNIIASGLDKTLISDAIQRLEKAINDLLYEDKLRKETASNTIRHLLQYDAQNRMQSVNTGVMPTVNTRPLNVGGTVSQ